MLVSVTGLWVEVSFAPTSAGAGSRCREGITDAGKRHLGAGGGQTGGSGLGGGGEISRDGLHYIPNLVPGLPALSRAVH